MRAIGGARRAGLGVAALLLAAGTLAACDGGGDEKPDAKGTKGASASASPSESGGTETIGAELTTVAEPATPIMVGANRYVSPCRVLTTADVQRIFPRAMRAGADVTQEYLDTSPSKAMLRRDDGVAATRCHYYFSDEAKRYLEVEVDQYAKPKTARKAWEHIRYLGTGKDSASLEGEEELAWLAQLARDNERDIGGRLVDGAPHLLYVPGHHDFVTYAGSTLVRLRLDTVVGAFEDKPLTPKQYAKQAPQMAKAARIVQRNATDRTLSQAPASTIIGPEKTVGTTPYLEPCQVLDTALATEIVGHAPNQIVTTESLDLDTAGLRAAAKPDDPYSATSSSSCQRDVQTDGPWGYASADSKLEIRYVDDPEQATKVMEEWMVVRAVTYAKHDKYDVIDLERAGLARHLHDTAADDAYVYDTKYLHQGDFRSVSIYFTVGHYVLELTGSRPVKGEEVPLEPDAYLPFVEKIVDKLGDQT